MADLQELLVSMASPPNDSISKICWFVGQRANWWFFEKCWNIRAWICRSSETSHRRQGFVANGSKRRETARHQDFLVVASDCNFKWKCFQVERTSRATKAGSDFCASQTPDRHPASPLCRWMLLRRQVYLLFENWFNSILFCASLLWIYLVTFKTLVIQSFNVIHPLL